MGAEDEGAGEIWAEGWVAEWHAEWHAGFSLDQGVSPQAPEPRAGRRHLSSKRRSDRPNGEVKTGDRMLLPRLR